MDRLPKIFQSRVDGEAGASAGSIYGKGQPGGGGEEFLTSTNLKGSEFIPLDGT